MEKSELKKLYTFLAEKKKEADLVDSLVRQLFEVLAPNNFPPFFEKDTFTSALDTVALILGEKVNEDASYWFYECEQGKRALSGSVNGKEYVFNELNTYLDFVTASP